MPARRNIGVIAAFFAFALPQLAVAQQYITPRTVSVTGYAEEKLAPDEAKLFVTVHTENRDLNTAKKEQDEKVAKLMKVVKSLNIEQGDGNVRTLYANLQPVYDYQQQTGKPKFRAYQLENQIEMTLDKVEVAGPLMDKLVEAGFDRIGNIQFGLKDERKKREALMEEALKDARDKAGKMAAALGATLGKPMTISESGSYTPPPMPMMRNMAMAADMAESKSMPTYSPTGVIEIQQTVNVTFELQ